MSSTLQLQTDPKVEHAFAHIAYDAPPTVNPDGSIDGDWDERKTNAEGYTAFLNVEPRHVYVLVQTPGYADASFDVQMPHDDLVTVPLEALPSLPITLPRVRIAGRHFVNPAGRWTLCGADSFQAYDRFLAGEDLRPVLAQLQALGFNTIRVFGMDKYIPMQLGRPIFNPYAHPNYYDELPVFCALAESFGLYVYFVVFADTGEIVPDEEDQVRHFIRTMNALRLSANTILSLVNEYTEHANYVNRSAFPRPSGIAASSGSAGMDQPTAPPWWDFDEFHPRRDRPGSIKDCCVVDHPNYLSADIAVVVDEPDRFGSQGNPDAEYAALQAGASVESSAGIVFHSKCGVYAQLLDGETERCAQAFLHALHGSHR